MAPPLSLPVRCAVMVAVTLAGTLAAPALHAQSVDEILASVQSSGLTLESDDVWSAIDAFDVYQGAEGLPASIDLSPYMPTPGYQGDRQGSCVAWTVSYALKTYHEAIEQQWSPAEPFSPSYVYNQIVQGTCGRGVSLSGGLQFLVDEGTVPMRLFPYEPAECVLQPDDSIREYARNFRIASFWRIEASDRTSVRTALAGGTPVVVGMRVGESFVRWEGADTYDQPDDTSIGLHAMLVIGYDDARGAYRLFNSWGRHWGDGGYVWIGYEAFEAMTDRAFVTRDATTPDVPKPQPTPDNPLPPPPPPPDVSPVGPTPAATPVCGDGRFESGGKEVCDGDDLGGRSCVSLGFRYGTLACDELCALDASACTNVDPSECGDGIRSAGEECDGQDFGGRTCGDWGLYQGELRCSATCELDLRGCNDPDVRLIDQLDAMLESDVDHMDRVLDRLYE